MQDDRPDDSDRWMQDHPPVIESDWTTAAGFRALVVMTKMGHRCGYVGVPQGHPLYGVSYSDPCESLKDPSAEPIGARGIIPLLCSQGELRRPDCAFDVHGGITYSDEAKDMIESDLWLFGFDCGHDGDSPSPEFIESIPEDLRHCYRDDGVHRSNEYVREHCESLAQQLIDRVIFPAAREAQGDAAGRVQP